MRYSSRALLASAAIFSATGCSDGPTATGRWAGMSQAGRFPAGASGVSSLAVADLTRDGSPDLLLVTRTPSATLRILVGAAGGFGAPRVVEGMGDPLRAATGDLDGDGAADLLAIGHFDNGFRVWRSASDEPRAFALANHGRNLLVADLDGDSRRDVIAIHDGSGQPVTVTAFRGDGSGSLARTWEHRTAHLTSQGACTGDFDGDRRTDLAVVTGDPAATTLFFRGHGDGTFAAPRALDPFGPAGAHDGAGEIACADLNGDGVTDLVTAHSSSSYATGRDLLSVRLGSADGPRNGWTASIAEPRDLALADLDRDGHVDAVLTHAETGELTFRPGRGDGTFAAPVTLATLEAAGRLAHGDFDRDGWTDLAIADGGSIVVLRNGGR